MIRAETPFDLEVIRRALGVLDATAAHGLPRLCDRVYAATVASDFRAMLEAKAVAGVAPRIPSERESE